MRKHLETNEECFNRVAKTLLDFLESDFGQSGKDVRIEAIVCELEAAYDMGYADA